MIDRFLLLILLFASLSLNGQPGPGGFGGRMPTIGRVYGKVIDAKSKVAIEYATVTLVNGKDSIISGALTKTNGDFAMDKLPFGKFRLKIQFMGYQTLVVPVSLNMNNIETDIGDLKLSLDSKLLNEVVIKDERPTVIIGVDRRIYNVDKDISARGATAVDVMKNIPGLTVDADGNVTLRNNSPTIFIDGRPTTLTMEQLPSDQIERVEVITNPSAKYDASAGGGIINVVLKKNNKPGYNGMIGLNAGTNQFDALNRYGINGNLNIKEGRFNFFTSYNLNHHGNPTKGYTHRVNYLNNTETGSFLQNNQITATRQMQHIRLGFDFTVSNRSTLTLAQSAMFGGFTTDESQIFEYDVPSHEIVSTGNRTNEQQNKMQNLNSQILWKHTYPRQGKEWTADFNYSSGKNSSMSDFYTNQYDSLGIDFATNTQHQKNTGSGNNQIFNLQFDFTNPLTDTARLEFGAKSSYRITETGLTVEQLQSGVWNKDTGLSTNYRIHDMTNALYVNYTNMFHGIGFQSGLRFEQTRFIADLVDRNLSYEYLYPNGTKNILKAIFPSIYLSRKWGTKHEVQLNFSRKINRPNYMQIIPYIMFSDKNNYQIGNPSLAPEFTNITELNYNLVLKSVSWLTSAYFRYQQNPITQFVYRSTTDSSVLVSTFINGDHNIASGWENTVKINFLNKKADFSVNANMFYSTISATSGLTTLTNSGINWNIKSMISYKFPKQYTLQLNGSYEAPRIIAQGKTKEVYSIDFSASKDIGKKLTFNFTINDIFNTRGFGSYYTTAEFSQDLWRRRDTRFFRIGFTYRFGEWDVSLFRRKQNKRDTPAMDQMDF